MTYFSIIFSVEKNTGLFSRGDRLPWKISDELINFKNITVKEYVKNKKNALIMGKNTYLEMAGINQDNRILLPITSDPNIECKHKILSFEDALTLAVKLDVGKIFLVGGLGLITKYICDEKCEQVYMSSLVFEKDIYKTDNELSQLVSYFPSFDFPLLFDYKLMEVCKKPSYCTKNLCGVEITYMVYNKYTTEENKYLKLLKHVLESGEQRMDRTSTGTLSVFGPQIEFDVSVFFPLLTTKKLNFRNILTEVLWFISGSTNTKYLLENGVNVWNGNTTREFLDKRGLKDYEVGDTGPLYGYQWRHYGGDFKDPESKGVDQLNRMLYILKTEPTSRRIFMSAWNPLDLDKMVLEPCHVSFQLYVEGGKYLNGKLYMRSNDMFLGAPWNIAGYTILLYIFCHLSGYKPGKLIYSIGDCHIYNDHIKQVETQLKRPMRPLPVLKIVKQCSTFEDFDADCFMLENYSPQSAIVGKISA